MFTLDSTEFSVQGSEGRELEQFFFFGLFIETRSVYTYSWNIRFSDQTYVPFGALYTKSAAYTHTHTLRTVQQQQFSFNIQSTLSSVLFRFHYI